MVKTMDSLKNRIEKIKKESEELIEKVLSEKDLDSVRTVLLGKKGIIPALNQDLEKLSIEEKRIIGPHIQNLRQQVEIRINEKRTELANILLIKRRERYKQFDVTLTRENPVKGSIHPLTLVTQELEAIFTSMGFETVFDREVEDEWHNFTALNIPHNHPARDAHDTFWIAKKPDLLLRTHTSSVQIRTMKKRKPPFAIFSPGRVFRNEATDASHDFQFMQGEALLVDRNISLAHLLDCSKKFLQTFFDNNTLEIRVRPSYFPFVKPGLEIDLQCPFCSHGCSSCKKTRWIELMGAGLVHSSVLQSCAIDPAIFSGFAMGFGISRLAMLKYKINDIRLLQSNKKEILSQFESLE
jgi:phenylalanyl-tRNA synthetase alpha chain